MRPIQVGDRGRFSENHIVEKGWGKFWEEGVDSERLTYRCLKGECEGGVNSGRAGYIF